MNSLVLLISGEMKRLFSRLTGRGGGGGGAVGEALGDIHYGFGFFFLVFCVLFFFLVQALAAKSSQRATGWRSWTFASEAALAVGMHVLTTHLHTHTNTPHLWLPWWHGLSVLGAT